MLKLFSLFILSLSSPQVFAQTATPQVCEAECFYADHSNSILYYGGRISSLQLSTTKAFAQITDQCQYGILLKRTLKGVETTEITDWNSEVSSSTRLHQGYRCAISESRTHQRIYTISHPELRAKFETVEATESNSCRPARDEDFPEHPTDGDGNDIVG